MTDKRVPLRTRGGLRQSGGMTRFSTPHRPSRRKRSDAIKRASERVSRRRLLSGNQNATFEPFRFTGRRWEGGRREGLAISHFLLCGSLIEVKRKRDPAPQTMWLI